MAVSLAVEGGPYQGISRAEIVRRARAMLRAVEQPTLELSVLLTDDERIKKLNGVYRKHDKPTDVLAFSQREGESDDVSGTLLGDVVLSIPTARRQAEKRGWDVMAEVTMLLAHGLLHLLGWDHDTPSKDRRMRRETDRLCRAAGAAVPLRSDARGGERRRRPVAFADSPVRGPRRAR